MYLFCALWIVFAVTALIGLKLHWLLVVCVALALNIANVVGYTKCEKDARKKVAAVAGSFLGSAMSHLASSMVASASGQ